MIKLLKASLKLFQKKKRNEPMKEPIKRAVWHTDGLPFVKSVIAVASGKGGVGKSTTAVNLARALAKQGKIVGLLDADIYGPSLPRMMGIKQKPELVDGKMIPPSKDNILCMSMGFMIAEEAAIIWRGPQVTKALQQMLRDVLWATSENPLDVLLIDMPPGTGDVHLSLAQQVPLTGAIIVTTPQEIALIDARKSIDMFIKVNVPILGVIENMSGFVDESGKINYIFGSGGGKKLAESTRCKFLGEIPIDITLREASDKGEAYADNAGVYSDIVLKAIGNHK